MSDANWAELIPRHPAPRAHPLVQTLLREMRKQRCSYGSISQRTGASAWVFKDWRRGRSPQLGEIERALAVVGLRITTVKMQSKGL